MRDLSYKLCTKSLSANQHIISVTRGSPNVEFPLEIPKSPKRKCVKVAQEIGENENYQNTGKRFAP